MEKNDVMRQTRMLSAFFLAIGLLWLATMFYCVFILKREFSFIETNICFFLTESVLGMCAGCFYAELFLRKRKKSFCREVFSIGAGLLVGVYNGVSFFFLVVSPITVGLGYLFYILVTTMFVLAFEDFIERKRAIENLKSLKKEKDEKIEKIIRETFIKILTDNVIKRIKKQNHDAKNKQN